MGYKNAVSSPAYIAFVRLIVMEGVVHYTRTLRVGHKFAPEPYQPSGGDKEFYPDVPFTVVNHVSHLALSETYLFNNAPHKHIVYIYYKVFYRLLGNAIDVFLYKLKVLYLLLQNPPVHRSHKNF